MGISSSSLIIFQNIFCHSSVAIICFSEYLVRLVSEFTNLEKLGFLPPREFLDRFFSEIIVGSGLC